MKILFLSPYPIEGPSYRYRVEQCLPYLKKEGIEFKVSTFLTSQSYRIIYKKGYLLKKILYFVSSFIRRLADLACSLNYDIIFIHLEALPIGPPVLEWLTARIGKKIIYDLDDAIYLPRSVDRAFINYLKCPWKVAKIIGLSKYVVTCNEHLKEYALQFNKNVCVIPTSLDLDKFCAPLSRPLRKELVIGWIGSHSTAKYLDSIGDVLRELSKKYKFIFRVVGAGERIDIPGVNVQNCEWSLEREAKDFQELDIGIYPLTEDEWIKGKPGFKTIQYMAVGVPCVVSGFGSNRDIVEDGINGFLANNKKEWLNKLSLLIEDYGLRKNFASNGRRTVEKKFSINVNVEKYIQVFKEIYKK